MIVTLLWKEFREHRAVWLILAVLSFLVLAGIREVVALAAPRAGNVGRSGGIGVVLLSIYGTVSGALMFANERERGTLPFLDSLGPAAGACLGDKAAHRRDSKCVAWLCA